jgi:hypothetical protein
MQGAKNCNIKLQCRLLWHPVLLKAFSSHPLFTKGHWVRNYIHWFFDPVLISIDVCRGGCFLLCNVGGCLKTSVSNVHRNAIFENVFFFQKKLYNTIVINQSGLKLYPHWKKPQEFGN